MKKLKALISKYRWLLLIILIAVTTQTLPLILSHRYQDGNLIITTAHDSLFHLSLIHELTQRFPPNNPGLAGESLTNYHYFSDIILSFFSVLQFPSWVIYYRIGPILASTMFVLSAYYFCGQLCKTKKARLIGTTAILFGGSFGYLGELIGISNQSSGNLFMLDQPFEMLTNVHTYLGFSLFLFASGLLLNGTKKRQLGTVMFASVLLGLAYGFKAYAAVVGLVALAAVAAHEIIVHRRFHLAIAGLIPGSMIFVLLYSLTSTTSAGLVFAPGWLLIKMVEDSDRLINLQNLSARLALYQLDQSYLKMSIVYAILTFVYLVGNLGVRALSGVILFNWIKKPKKLHASKIYLLAVIGVSLFFPLLFYQGNSAYNIIQFGQYGLMLSAALLGVVFEKYGSRIRYSSLIVGLGLILLIPTSLQAIRMQLDFSARGEVVTSSEQEAFKYLREETASDSVVLTHDQSRHSYLMLIPALAQRRVYYSGEVYAGLTGVDVSERVQKVNDFFNPETPIKDKVLFLDHNGIDYIYLDTIHLQLFEKVSDKMNLDKVVDNGEVVVYKYES